MSIIRLYGDIDVISNDILNEVSMTYVYYNESKEIVATARYNMKNCCLSSIKTNKKILHCFPSTIHMQNVLIQFENNQYGFACADSGEIFPYYFDYATTFDEDGYALVARNGQVNIMNSNFEIFDLSNDSWISLREIGKSPCDFIGYDDISWHNENYLAKIWNLNIAPDKTGELSFIGKNGKLINFETYNKENNKIEKTNIFYSSPDNDFNHENAMLLDDGSVVFANGTYVTGDDVPGYLLDELSFTSLGLKIKKLVNNK